MTFEQEIAIVLLANSQNLLIRFEHAEDMWTYIGEEMPSTTNDSIQLQQKVVAKLVYEQTQAILKKFVCP